MNLSKRDFLQVLTAASAAGLAFAVDGADDQCSPAQAGERAGDDHGGVLEPVDRDAERVGGDGVLAD